MFVLRPDFRRSLVYVNLCERLVAKKQLLTPPRQERYFRAKVNFRRGRAPTPIPLGLQGRAILASLKWGGERGDPDVPFN